MSTELTAALTTARLTDVEAMAEVIFGSEHANITLIECERYIINFVLITQDLIVGT